MSDTLERVPYSDLKERREARKEQKRQRRLESMSSYLRHVDGPYCSDCDTNLVPELDVNGRYVYPVFICPNCSGQVGDWKVTCPHGGLTHIVNELADIPEPQSTLNEWGIDVPEELDNPKWLTGPCAMCGENERRSFDAEVCFRCSSDLQATHMFAEERLYNSANLASPDRRGVPKQYIQKILRVFCRECDQHDPDIQDEPNAHPLIQLETVKRATSPELKCCVCDSENVLAIDVWRKSAGFVFVDELMKVRGVEE